MQAISWLYRRASAICRPSNSLNDRRLYRPVSGSLLAIRLSCLLRVSEFDRPQGHPPLQLRR